MRQVDTGDAVRWLSEPPVSAPLVSALPDAAETGMGLDEWAAWFQGVAWLAFDASSGPTIFIVTDRKAEGRWISKPRLLMEAGGELIWHRIALRRPPGSAEIHRPTYTHVLCFGPGRPGYPTPDVLPPDQRTWGGGTAFNVALMVTAYLRDQGATAVLNPFSGQGTILAAANAHGLDAYGCELDAGRAELARHFTIAVPLDQQPKGSTDGREDAAQLPGIAPGAADE